MLAAGTAMLAACATTTSAARSAPVWREITTSTMGADAGLNFDPRDAAHYPQLLVFHGRLFVTWYEDEAGASRIRVSEYDDRATPARWVRIDGGTLDGLNRDPGMDAYWSRLVAFDDRLYAYWFEKVSDTSTTVRVSVYHADGGTWSPVGGAGGLRYDANGSADYASLESAGGKLYAAWRERDGTGASQIRVAVYNGNDTSPRWRFVDRGADGGINVNRSVDAFYPKLQAFDGRLYVMWYELDGGVRTMHCAVYNMNDARPAWTLVGENGGGINYDAHKDAFGPQILGANGSLYGVWYERGTDGVGHVRVARLDTSTSPASWQFLDGDAPGGLNRSPSADAWWARATSLGRTMFVAWTEDSRGVYLLHVSALDTDTGTWRSIDGRGGLNHDPDADTEYAHMAALADRVFVTWSERTDGVLQVRVAAGTVP